MVRKEVKSLSKVLLDNEELMDRIKKESYDFAILDPAFVDSYLLPYSLGIPYASYGVRMWSLLNRVPCLPSMVPSVVLADNAMTFKNRLTTFAI